MAPVLSTPCWRRRCWSPVHRNNSLRASSQMIFWREKKVWGTFFTCPGVIVLSKVMLLTVGPNLHGMLRASWNWKTQLITMYIYVKHIMHFSVQEKGHEKGQSMPGCSAAWIWPQSTSSWRAWTSKNIYSSALSNPLSPGSAVKFKSSAIFFTFFFASLSS